MSVVIILYSTYTTHCTKSQLMFIYFYTWRFMVHLLEYCTGFGMLCLVCYLLYSVIVYSLHLLYLSTCLSWTVSVTVSLFSCPSEFQVKSSVVILGKLYFIPSHIPGPSHISFSSYPLSVTRGMTLKPTWFVENRSGVQNHLHSVSVYDFQINSQVRTIWPDCYGRYTTQRN